MNQLFVFTNLDKEHLKKETEQACTQSVQLIISKVPEFDANLIRGLKQNDQFAHQSVVDLATATFDQHAGHEMTDLQRWRADFQRDFEKEDCECGNIRQERDRLERTKADSMDRVLPFTPMEKFESIFLIIVAILLWVIGYLSMTELIKSLDTPLHPLAIYLIPVAGVTVLAFTTKMILGIFKGTRLYSKLLIGCMIAALLAALGWLFFFSEFIQISSQKIEFQSLDAAPGTAGKGDAGFGYMIMTVLAEAMGAAAAWGYVSYIYHAKTIRSHGVNPEWQNLDEMHAKQETKCQELQRLIALCDSLHSKFEAGRREYVAKAVLLYQSKPS